MFCDRQLWQNQLKIEWEHTFDTILLHKLNQWFQINMQWHIIFVGLVKIFCMDYSLKQLNFLFYSLFQKIKFVVVIDVQMYQFMDFIDVHATLPGKSQKSPINVTHLANTGFCYMNLFLVYQASMQQRQKKSSIG